MIKRDSKNIHIIAGLMILLSITNNAYTANSMMPENTTPQVCSRSVEGYQKNCWPTKQQKNRVVLPVTDSNPAQVANLSHDANILQQAIRNVLTKFMQSPEFAQWLSALIKTYKDEYLTQIKSSAHKVNILDFTIKRAADTMSLVLNAIYKKLLSLQNSVLDEAIKMGLSRENIEKDLQSAHEMFAAQLESFDINAIMPMIMMGIQSNLQPGIQGVELMQTGYMNPNPNATMSSMPMVKREYPKRQKNALKTPPFYQGTPDDQKTSS